MNKQLEDRIRHLEQIALQLRQASREANQLLQGEREAIEKAVALIGNLRDLHDDGFLDVVDGLFGLLRTPTAPADPEGRTDFGIAVVSHCVSVLRDSLKDVRLTARKLGLSGGELTEGEPAEVRLPREILEPKLGKQIADLRADVKALQQQLDEEGKQEFKLEATGLQSGDMVSGNTVSVALVNFAGDVNIRLDVADALAKLAMPSANLIAQIFIGVAKTTRRIYDAARAQSRSLLTRLSAKAIRSASEAADTVDEAVKGLTERDPDRRALDFVANASHELRVPLASLSGFIETLLGPAASDDAARVKFLNIMLQQTKRMSRQVDALLSLGAAAAGSRRQAVAEEHVDLASLVTSVAGTFRLLGQNRGVSIVEDLAASQSQVVASRDQLSIVLENIVSNAVNFSPENGTVRIAVGYTAGGVAKVDEFPIRQLHRDIVTAPEIHERYLFVAVEDDGPGITSEHLQRVAERYYRIDVAQSGQFGGVGLGLAVVKEIVIASRWGLRFETAPDVGSRVILFVPATRMVDSIVDGERG